MGFLDILTGKRKVKQPPESRLFAMSTAAITLEMTLELKSSGKAAIVFQPLATADFTSIVTDMEEVLRGTGEDTGTHVEKTDDSFGYRWMVLGDEDFEDLVGGDQRRDSERELRLKAQIGHELPVEPELERWFPLWGIPI